MKVCKYCGAENKDESKFCESCGAKSFKNKCSNCGTVFDGGNFCPKCGVNINTKPKKCPKCGKIYYSNACPDCGYKEVESTSKTVDRPYDDIDNRILDVISKIPTSYQKPKSSIILWILGWIFIYPIPLSKLIRRNTNIGKPIKWILIALAWISYFRILS